MMRLMTLAGIIWVSACLISTPAHAATSVAGVSFDDTIQLESGALYLNGAGIRSKFIFKAYVIGLYLPERKSSPADIMALKGFKRLRIVTLRDLTGAQFADALIEGIRRNFPENEHESLKPRIDALTTAILDISSTASGSVITLDWRPGQGTQLWINGIPRSGMIPGEDFFHALLAIWIGPRPAQADLKNALLGLNP